MSIAQQVPYPTQGAAAILGIIVVFWAAMLTGFMVAGDPPVFLCGESSCGAADVAEIFGRNALVILWLVAPYFLAAWLLWRFAPRLNRAMPARLRWHPRWSRAMRLILIGLLILGQTGVAFVTYVMLEHNPQGAYCTQVAAGAAANYYGYGPCYITIGELTALFATNVLIVAMVAIPIAIASWVFTALAVSLERGRGRRWLGGKPFG